MKNLFKALANFQQEVPVIHKGTVGYGYSYADLPAIFEVINPLLKKHGLGFTQMVNGTSIKTIIFHLETGELIESTTDIPQGVQLSKMNEFQVLGSAITYIRRYALSSILGLVTDKDTDAAGEQITKPEIEKEWLNKYSDKAKTVITDKWIAVVNSLKSGYTIEQVESKYKLSKDLKAELLNILTI